MAAQVKVPACMLGMLWPGLNSDPVCDASAAEGVMRYAQM